MSVAFMLRTAARIEATRDRWKRGRGSKCSHRNAGDAWPRRRRRRSGCGPRRVLATSQRRARELIFNPSILFLHTRIRPQRGYDPTASRMTRFVSNNFSISSEIEMLARVLSPRDLYDTHCGVSLSMGNPTGIPAARSDIGCQSTVNRAQGLHRFSGTTTSL